MVIVLPQVDKVKRGAVHRRGSSSPYFPERIFRKGGRIMRIAIVHGDPGGPMEQYPLVPEWAAQGDEVRMTPARDLEAAGAFGPQVVITASPRLEDVTAARRLARRARCPLVFELRANWTDLEADHRGRPNRQTRKALKLAVGKSRQVVSLLPEGPAYLEALGLPHGATACLPLVPDPPPPNRELGPRHRAQLEQLRQGYDFLVLYEGDLTWERGLGRLIDAAKLLEEQGLAVVLAGDGRHSPELRRQMLDRTAANVYLLDPVDPDQKAALCRYADCLYYGEERAPVVQYGVTDPGLLERMAYGRPMVTAFETPLRSPVVEAGCGLHAGGPDAAALARTLARIQAMSPHQRDAMGARGPAYLGTHHNPKEVSKAYRRLLEEAVIQK